MVKSKTIFLCIFLVLCTIFCTGCEFNKEKGFKVTALKPTKHLNMQNGELVNDYKPYNDYNIKMPTGFKVKDMKMDDKTVLHIGEDNRAFIVFGADFTDPQETYDLKIDENLLTGFVNYRDVFLVTYTNNKLRFNSYSCYDGAKHIISEFKDYNLGSDYRIITKDKNQFYLTYQLNNVYHIDTFKLAENKVILEESNKFRADVVKIFADKNTIFLERKNGNKHYLDILNKKLAVLDIISLEEDNEILKLNYSQEDNESLLHMYYKSANNTVKKCVIPQENNYKSLASHTVIENKKFKYNTLYEKHYLIYDKKSVFVNGVYKDTQLQKSIGYGYYRMSDDSIIKTDLEFKTVYFITEQSNGTNEYLKIDDYYVGLNEENKICYIDPSYQDEILNQEFIGETIGFGEIFKNPNDNKLYYINEQEKALYSIDANRIKQLVLKIPEDKWQDAMKKGYGEHISYYVDNNAVSIIGNSDWKNDIHKMHYYNLHKKEWKTITKKSEIYISELGLTYNGIGELVYIFNGATLSFEPCYINNQKYFNTFILDNILYVYGYHHNIKNDSSFKICNSQYILYNSKYGIYNITDAKNEKDHSVLKEYQTNTLIKLTNEGITKPIDMSVRLFDVSKKGILFSGYKQDAILYYYDYNTKKVATLSDKGLITELALNDNFAIFTSLYKGDNYLNKYNFNTGEVLQLKIKEVPSEFKLSGNYLAVSLSNSYTIDIVDINKFKIVDTIDGSDFTWHDNELYYACGGLLVKYSTQSKTAIILRSWQYSYPCVYHQNSLYCCYSPGDAGWALLKYDIKEIKLPQEKNIDFYIIKAETDFLADLSIYDINNKRLNFIKSGTKIKYQIDKNTIKYQVKNQYFGKWINHNYKVEKEKVIKKLRIAN
ncbi:hypothetical protein IMX26_13815 [Clostridium sp. 'deep sea']|uniref:hypothetical protein n=1 Tax=Clostridium sp. 'deep sea' TaxID=2779445 RepID=UPI0018965AF8|nr:hypothetical protein [Clostridium sp. 'deep sea']QOR34542.1 hypothetical protein IMX26_13815 [Clostridium sp. 'deep sea']